MNGLQVIGIITLVMILDSAFSQNTRPVFTGTYPHTVNVDERKKVPSGLGLKDTDPIYTFTATDADAVNVFLTFTFDPPESSDMFDTNETFVSAGTTTGRVFLKDFREFDFEEKNHYKIYCEASDGVANSATAVLLNILIVDVGENSTIYPPNPSMEYEAAEGPAGNKIGDPRFVIVDTDSAEIHKWTVTGGEGKDYVNVNLLNGTLSLKKNYDREAVPPLPGQVDVNVMITDRFNLSYNFTYKVTFKDANDHIPIFKEPEAWLDVSRENLTLGDVFLTFNVSDGDAESPNKDITLMLDSSNSYTDYFSLNGTDLVYSFDFDLEYGDGPFSFYVFAVDDGATPLTGTATISFGLPEATTAPPTTTDIPDQVTGGDEMSTNNNMVYMMIACAFLAALIVGYLLVLCWRWHTYGQCLPDFTKGGVDCCSCPKNVDDEGRRDYRKHTRRPGNQECCRAGKAVRKVKPKGPKKSSKVVRNNFIKD